MSVRSLFVRSALAAAVFFAIAAAAIVPASAQGALTGVVRAHDETVVLSEASGIIERILVQEGDEVVEGAILVELRRERQQIAVEASKAGLARAQAQLTETKVVLDAAEKELGRLLPVADAIPKKDIDDRQRDVERLRANLNVQTAEVSRAEQDMRLREHDLSETRLLAPFGGSVTRIRVHRGDTLKPMDTPVIELVNLRRLYVEVLVTRQQAQRLRNGQTVQVSVEREWLGQRGRVAGHVSYINPTVDAASRMVTVKIDIPNDTGTIRPGMLADVRM